MHNAGLVSKKDPLADKNKEAVCLSFVAASPTRENENEKKKKRFFLSTVFK